MCVSGMVLLGLGREHSLGIRRNLNHPELLARENLAMPACISSRLLRLEGPPLELVLKLAGVRQCWMIGQRFCGVTWCRAVYS